MVGFSRSSILNFLFLSTFSLYFQNLYYQFCKLHFSGGLMLHQLQKFVEVHGPLNFDVVYLKITIPLYPYISQPSYPNYSENSCDPPWMWYKGRRTPRKGRVSTKAFFILMNEKLLLLLDIYEYFSQLLALVIIDQMT